MMNRCTVIGTALACLLLAALPGCKGKRESRLPGQPASGRDGSSETGTAENGAVEGNTEASEAEEPSGEEGSGTLAIPEAVFPALAERGAASRDFVPPGWTLECDKAGDISMDGLPDLVLVLKHTDPANILLNPDGLGEDTINTNPRILAMALGLPGSGYRLVTENHTLIPRHVDPDVDDFMGDCPEISRGAFKVVIGFFASAGTWWTWNSTFSFRYQDSRLRLIGYDYFSLKRNTGLMHKRSLNYLTGRIEYENGSISSDPGPAHADSLKGNRMIAIEDIGGGDEFQSEGSGFEWSDSDLQEWEDSQEGGDEPPQ